MADGAGTQQHGATLPGPTTPCWQRMRELAWLRHGWEQTSDEPAGQAHLPASWPTTSWASSLRSRYRGLAALHRGLAAERRHDLTVQRLTLPQHALTHLVIRLGVG